MADKLNIPAGADYTSSAANLAKGPQDMPDRGGPKPIAQVTSSTVNLGRKESPVAQFGANPGMGEVQCTSSQAGLHRNATSPYDNISATKPQVPFKGK